MSHRNGLGLIGWIPIPVETKVRVLESLAPTIEDVKTAEARPDPVLGAIDQELPDLRGPRKKSPALAEICHGIRLPPRPVKSIWLPLDDLDPLIPGAPFLDFRPHPPIESSRGIKERNKIALSESVARCLQTTPLGLLVGCECVASDSIGTHELPRKRPKTAIKFMGWVPPKRVILEDLIPGIKAAKLSREKVLANLADVPRIQFRAWIWRRLPAQDSIDISLGAASLLG
jgi:hypothetical protein